MKTILMILTQNRLERNCLKMLERYHLLSLETITLSAIISILCLGFQYLVKIKSTICPKMLLRLLLLLFHRDYLKIY